MKTFLKTLAQAGCISLISTVATFGGLAIVAEAYTAYTDHKRKKNIVEEEPEVNDNIEGDLF